MVTNLDNVLFKYVSQGNPKSNEDLKRFLRLYPVSGRDHRIHGDMASVVDSGVGPAGS